MPLARNPLIMNKLTLESLLYIFVFLVALLLAQPVSAHGGDPRVEISTDRLNPGSVLEIRGVGFEFEEQVTLALIGPQIEIPLGTAIGDAEGIFLVTISLPVDLAEGIYVVHAVTADHVVESPEIMVWGAAQVEPPEESQRTEEDALLAPMPTFDLNFAATPAPKTTALEPSAPKPKSNTLIYLVVAGLGIVSLLGIRLFRKR